MQKLQMESLQKSPISEQQSHVIIDTTEIPEDVFHEATHWEPGQFIIEFISSRVLPVSPDLFRANSFQLLKLENLLQ